MTIKKLALVAAIIWSASSHAQDAAALSEFEKLVATCKAAFEAQQLQDVIYVAPTKMWAHRLFSRAEISYDVQRTSSLVSPYTALLKIAQSFNSARAPEEAAARALPVALDSTALHTVQELRFAYQSGAWKLQGATQTERSSPASAVALGLDTVRYTPETIRRSRGPVQACLGD